MCFLRSSNLKTEVDSLPEVGRIRVCCSTITLPWAQAFGHAATSSTLGLGRSSHDMTTKPSPMQECPRFPRCSVNHCPLDPDQDQHLADPQDRERKCPMEKNVRHRIGFKYHHLLPLDGLTPAEAAGARSWAKLPVAEQWERKEAARERMAKLRDRRNPRP